jgi:poly(3-hydroxyalkanoate) synthetase
MGRSDSLEKVFSYIESNDLHQMRNYFLSESLSDEDPLPKDFEIKNL